MEINTLKLNENEYLLRKDEWIRKFEVLESNKVTAYHNVVFEKVDGRIIGFMDKNYTYYLADEKLNQIVFRSNSQSESQIFEDMKKWLNENIKKQYDFLIQLN